jgi:hypothetical protein
VKPDFVQFVTVFMVKVMKVFSDLNCFPDHSGTAATDAGCDPCCPPMYFCVSQPVSLRFYNQDVSQQFMYARLESLTSLRFEKHCDLLPLSVHIL